MCYFCDCFCVYGVRERGEEGRKVCVCVSVLFMWLCVCMVLEKESEISMCFVTVSY